jgi:uncharacterized protein YecE (DUF72 family)
MDRLQTPPIVTTDFIYLRLIGDRSIHESNFGKLQIDRRVEMEKWAEKIKEIKNNEKVLKPLLLRPIIIMGDLDLGQLICLEK